MKQYESMFDDTDNVVQNRICVFVNKFDSDGNIENYQFSKIITTEYAGVLFVIDESEFPSLNNYKVDFTNGKPRLIRKDDAS